MKWLASVCKSVKLMGSVAVDTTSVNFPMNYNVVQVLEGPSVSFHAKKAAAALLSGHVLALPTDTLYGIAALAQDNQAIENIYKIKRRNTTKPLAICVAEVGDVYLWGKVTVPLPLLKSLLPGPVTLVFERTPQLNPALNPGTDLVGIRIPDEEFIRTVVKDCGSPLALTSANISARESPLCVEDFSELWDKLHSVYDSGHIGGETDCREGSTIIDLSQVGSYRLIRRGIAYSSTIKRIKRERREAAISLSLVTRLKEAVQSVLQPGGTASNNGGRYPSGSYHGPVLGHSDNTNVLCNVLEAVFIHGLRDSLGERMSVLLGADPDRMPVPNFWPVVLIISHRDLIKQVSELSFISSEVGRSRAWIRLALNQGQICSYLSVLLQDSRTLKDYYKPTALLRDAERADIMLGILQPLSSLTFSLATNAAVLNTWTQTPLVIAGLWTPSIQSAVFEPVLAATDVASTVYDLQSQGIDIPVASTPISDQMFDMIIGGTPETSFISNHMEKKESDTAKQAEESPPKTKKIEDRSSLIDEKEKTLLEKSVSVDDSEDINQRKQSTVSEEETNQLEGSLVSTVSNKEYRREWSIDSMSRSLIEAAPEYNRLFSDLEDPSRFPSLPGLVVPHVDLSPSTSTPSEEVSNESSQSDVAEKLSYEVLSQKLPSAEETQCLLPLLTRLTTEEGLDSQLYKCHQCKSYIGMIYGKPRVCSYDSKYYCYECHENELTLIPARLIHNWDFTLYPVCTANSQWLSAISHQPLIDLRTVNPKLYCHIEDLAELQMLRTQLLYVRAYLFTCRSDAGQNLRKMVWPREHLYEHVHLYSVHDLQLVASGQLVSQVRHAVTFGRDHIAHCELCSARGFHCELCSDSEVIYPFQLGNTYTCTVCYGVYHSLCARGWKECPRCLRWAARREGHQATADHL